MNHTASAMSATVRLRTVLLKMFGDIALNLKNADFSVDERPRLSLESLDWAVSLRSDFFEGICVPLRRVVLRAVLARRYRS